MITFNWVEGCVSAELVTGKMHIMRGHDGDYDNGLPHYHWSMMIKHISPDVCEAKALAGDPGPSREEFKTILKYLHQQGYTQFIFDRVRKDQTVRRMMYNPADYQHRFNCDVV